MGWVRATEYGVPGWIMDNSCWPGRPITTVNDLCSLNFAKILPTYKRHQMLGLQPEKHQITIGGGPAGRAWAHYQTP